MAGEECTAQIGRNLKTLREESGLSQKEVADVLNIERSTYTNYELGKILPPLNMIYRLARAFGVDYTVILEGESRPERSDVRSVSPAAADSQQLELSREERMLVLRYRMMSQQDRQAVADLAEQAPSLPRQKRPHRK